MKLNEFFAELDGFDGRVPLEDVRSLMERLDVTAGDLGGAVSFGDSSYRRNLVRRTPDYEALVLCWKPGQRSPIHDHAQSTCGVRVIEGVATETRFEHDAEGRLRAAGTEEFFEGSAAGSQDADIHEIANEGESNLITLHVYSPSIGTMKTYARTYDFGEEPFEDWIRGAGRICREASSAS